MLLDICFAAPAKRDCGKEAPQNRHVSGERIVS